MLQVLIVDDNHERALGLSRLVRIAGGLPTLSDRLGIGAYTNVVFADDDSFGGSGAEIARLAGRISPHIFRCVCARWVRFAAVNTAAEYVLIKPYSQSALMDVLAAARSRAVYAHG